MPAAALTVWLPVWRVIEWRPVAPVGMVMMSLPLAAEIVALAAPSVIVSLPVRPVGRP